MIKLTIHGNPPSKSNCYRVGTIGRGKGGRGILFKTKELKAYEENFEMQISGDLRVNLDCELKINIECHFDSRRPDLDNAAKVILDSLQKAKVIKNDRSVMELRMTKNLDKLCPRIEIEIERIKYDSKTKNQSQSETCRDPEGFKSPQGSI